MTQVDRTQNQDRAENQDRTENQDRAEDAGQAEAMRDFVDGGEPGGTANAGSNVIVALARRLWRSLTSMRTALILLFLLALAAIPGSLLPQRNLHPDDVNRYLVDHPDLAPWLDRAGAFNVFSSVWFSAIYLLLFISLVGCLIPRLRGHLVAVLRVPPDAPARLFRMPVHTEGLATADDPATAGQVLHELLKKRRFRVRTRAHDDGTVTVSGEKGYLKETGNLLFHFSLLTILTGVALGSWYGYHADRLMVEGADQGFCNTLQQYDDYGLGARVNPGKLEPFCIQLDAFHATYNDTAVPLTYTADITYSLGDGPEHNRVLKVNDPLRLAKARVYLLGHGFAPVIKYTDRYGRSQTTVAPFLPQNTLNDSLGVAEFPDVNVPPGGVDPDNKQQVAFAGTFVPTSDGKHAGSVFPGARNPVLVLTPYRGDLGLDAGIPQSVYSLNQSEIDSGRLKPVGDAPLRLKPGQSASLDDGTTVQFVGYRQWVSVSVRYDPGEKVVLVGAACLLSGLLAMLFGRRRRLWFRVAPGTGGGSAVAAGALARGEYTGFGAEFGAVISQTRTELDVPDSDPDEGDKHESSV